MRDIRARIAQRHGIDLSAQQIQELAARRLEAILDPRNINPSLLEQLRKAAGERPAKVVPDAAAHPPYTFEDTTLYESSRGLLSAIRKLLNPILKLFFNPNPLIHALHAQVKVNAEQAERENEHKQRQAEWNALHYELLQRTVTESARLSLEVQALALRVESLAARVDFTDRRVRTLEASPPGRQERGRPPQDVAAIGTPAPTAPQPAQPFQQTAADGATSPDGQRRRRRRRRGRRSGGSFGDGAPPGEESTANSSNDTDDFDDGSGDDNGSGERNGAQETVAESAPLEPVERAVAPPASVTDTPDPGAAPDGGSRATADGTPETRASEPTP